MHILSRASNCRLAVNTKCYLSISIVLFFFCQLDCTVALFFFFFSITCFVLTAYLFLNESCSCFCFCFYSCKFTETWTKIDRTTSAKWLQHIFASNANKFQSTFSGSTYRLLSLETFIRQHNRALYRSYQSKNEIKAQFTRSTDICFKLKTGASTFSLFYSCRFRFHFKPYSPYTVDNIARVFEKCEQKSDANNFQCCFMSHSRALSNQSFTAWQTALTRKYGGKHISHFTSMWLMKLKS